GDGYGVFQFEAPQVKRMLMEGRPENVVDLAAINAANRPGPIGSGNTERYLQNRRSGRDGVALYPSIRKILEPTGGVLLFQEQVMEIARELAGYSLGEADVLRKAMGKKKAEIMDEQKRRFLAGAAGRKVPAREAGEIWDMMEKFAGYGFNKAHSTCYSWISYQTAYLKTHYPHFFMAAMLNNNLGNSDKLAEILAQCKKMQIPVLPPSVNDGGFSFTPTRDGRIIFGLGGIKGIGNSAVDAILEQRRVAGPFKTLEGFFNRTRRTGVNKKALQSLAMAGAFDCLLPDRKELIRNLDDIEGFLRGPDRQEALFGGFDDEVESTALLSKEVTDMDVALMEKQAIGLFLTHHPFEDHPIYRDVRHLQLTDLQQSVTYDPTRWQDKPLPSKGLAGLLTEVKLRLANTSQKMYAKARLEDPERSVSVIIWPKAYEEARQCIEENAPVVVWGRLQLPEISDEQVEAWDQLEIVVDRIAPYQMDKLPGGESDSAAGQRGSWRAVTGNGTERLTSGPAERPQAEPAGLADPGHQISDAFSPLPINWEIDLGRATSEQLAELAHELEECQGDR
ncbi:MAG TPA: hypothetical protein ENO21_03050, partial [Firmicutes bacterium]|nr:hypothetical protein [Bacillota bacterium]